MPKENLEEYFYNHMIKKLIIMTAKKKPQIKILCYMKHFQWFVYQKVSSKKLESEPQAWKICNIVGKQWSLMKNPGLGCEVRKEKTIGPIGN